MKNEKMFVQFMHPGGEHSPDQNGIRAWNTGQHQRKFLKVLGKYIDRGNVYENDICFWGEWEPQSIVDEYVNKPIANGPRFIYKPYYNLNELPVSYQNTDPFVFGNNFYYTVCHQVTEGGPTYLQSLDKGSVILFGSHKKEHFLLDTVFVIDHWIDYDSICYKKDLEECLKEPTYEDVTLKQLERDSNNTPYSKLRLYVGANYENTIDGMYSYFPSILYEKGTKGFIKPIIEIPDIINSHRKMNFKGTILSANEIKDFWNVVLKQVTKTHGLKPGVFAELPKQTK